MSTELTRLLISCFFLHYCYDFVLQDRDTAENKSKSIKTLLYHCLIYSLWPLWLFDFTPRFYMMLILFISHVFIDGITSKMNAYFYQNNKMKYFWNNIGFDQFLHSVVIIVSLYVLCKGT